MFTAKKMFLNMIRNRGRSAILAVFSFLTVFFVGIYFGNLEQNEGLLSALGEKIPVSASIANSTGDRLTGLDITEKRVELFLELGLKDYTVTAESYGNIGFGPENTEQRASIYLTGTNTAASMDAWKPEFSLERAQVEEILSEETGQGPLLERGTAPQNLSNTAEESTSGRDVKRTGRRPRPARPPPAPGLPGQEGDVIDINLYRALYDEFDGVAGFVEITSAELEIAGFYQTAPESALEAADLVCPLSWLAEQHRQAGSELLYSSAKGTVADPLALNDLKIKAEKAKFPQTNLQSIGGRPGNALVIDDRFFIQTASQLKSSIHLLKLFMAPLLVLVTGISAMVSFFAMCHRKQEIYLERCMGRKKSQIVAELVGENTVLSLLDGAAALLFIPSYTEMLPVTGFLHGGDYRIFILAAFLGIRIVTTLAPAIWISRENPMK
ncbi:MAG: hypothetical protein K1W40_01555 [Schaedlerella sp.]|uniref:hypothetical protein n=1 Tax=Schaedlerella sp. TaxID=2676057 RepID=UPI0035287916